MFNAMKHHVNLDTSCHSREGTEDLILNNYK